MDEFKPIIMSSGKVKRKLFFILDLKEAIISFIIALVLFQIGNQFDELLGLVLGIGGFGIGIFIFFPIQNLSVAKIIIFAMQYGNIAKDYYYYNLNWKGDEIKDEIEEKTIEERYKPEIN